MNGDWVAHTPQVAGVGPRVSQACTRCRKQKLKCDVKKPCTLCLRVGVDCQPQSSVLPSIPGRAKRSTEEFDNAFADSGSKRQMFAKTPSVGSIIPAVHEVSDASTRPNPEGSQTPRVQVGPDPQPSGHERIMKSPSESRTSPGDTNQFGANSSAMSFARTVFGRNDTSPQHETSPHGGMSDIPGGHGHSLAASTWTLKGMQMPELPVIEALIGAYFDRMHWFIFLFHELSFLERARGLLVTSVWRRKDASALLTILMVAAMGAQCVIHDETWLGHQVMKQNSVDLTGLLNLIISQVRLHLLDILEDCEIESVQTCILLGTFYIYHGSPNLAWSVLGMSARTAYALALHRDAPTVENRISTEVRRRCWNHVKVADTFAAMIYGRPASLDPAFSESQLPEESDDTLIPLPLREHPALNQTNIKISMLTFHHLKYRLYEIISETISSFRLLRLHETLPRENLGRLLQSIQDAEALLAKWREILPPFFDYERWQNDDPFCDVDGLPTKMSPDLEKLKRILIMQAITLQVTYDSAIILIHRPLLEYSLSSSQDGTDLNGNSMSRSLNISVDAALRTSRIPFSLFEKELSVSFIFMHFFTAGVILCIPPTNHPFSITAQEAKAGVIRIIRANRTMRHCSQIARHAEQLLTELLKITIQREMSSALYEETQKDLRSTLANASSGGNPPVSADASWDESIRSIHQTHPVNDGLISGNGLYSANAVGPMSQTEDLLANSNSDISVFANEPIDAYLAPDHSSNEYQLPFQMDQQLNQAFGAFGEVMFNLVPDDPYTAWSWGLR